MREGQLKPDLRSTDYSAITKATVECVIKRVTLFLVLTFSNNYSNSS